LSSEDEERNPIETRQREMPFHPLLSLLSLSPSLYAFSILLSTLLSLSLSLSLTGSTDTDPFNAAPTLLSRPFAKDSDPVASTRAPKKANARELFTFETKFQLIARTEQERSKGV
jgi:hypothetical protein